MKKEILFAVSIGLVIGLIITFGMYRARVAMTTNSTVNPQAQSTPTLTPATTNETENAPDAFLVSEPQDESLLSDPKIRVSGQAFPNAAIVILLDGSETVGSADEKGNFSLALTLAPGANLLTIRALGDNHVPLEVTRSVVVSSADLTATPSALPKASPTPSAKPKATPKVTPKSSTGVNP